MKWLFSFLLMLPALAMAGTVSVSWVAPTTLVNGDDIAAVDSYAIVMRKNNEDLTPIIVAGDQTSHLIEGVGVGIYSLYMTATVNGLQSSPSQVVSFSVEQITSDPNPPSITIQFNGFASDSLEVR